MIHLRECVLEQTFLEHFRKLDLKKFAKTLRKQQCDVVT